MNRHRTRVFNILIALGLTIVLVVILFYNMVKYLKNNTLFVPTNELHWNALEDPSYDAKEVNLSVEGERVHGWYFEPTVEYLYKSTNTLESDRKVILFLHGNSGNISCREEIVNLVVNVCQCPMLIFDYRGYGQSEGKATLSNIKEDSEAMYRYLIDDMGYRSSEVILWGKSLGGYGASYLASIYEVHALMLMYTFSTFASILKDKKAFATIIDYIMDDESDNVEHVANCKAHRVCLVHSKTDGFIPYDCSLELYDRLGSNCDRHFVTIDGSHSNPIITEDQLRHIVDLIGIPIDRIPAHDDELCSCLQRIQHIKLLQPPD